MDFEIMKVKIGKRRRLILWELDHSINGPGFAPCRIVHSILEAEMTFEEMKDDFLDSVGSNFASLKEFENAWVDARVLEDTWSDTEIKTSR